MSRFGAQLILGAPDTPEQRAFLGRLVERLVFFGIQLLLTPLLLSAVGDPGADDLNRVLLMGIGVAIITTRPFVPSLSQRYGPAMWPFIITAGFGLTIAFAFGFGDSWGSISGFVALFICGGCHAFFRGRQAWTWVGTIIVGFVLAMAALGGPDALGRSLVGAALCLVAGFTIDHILDRLTAARAAEAAAREAADVARDELVGASDRKREFLARVSHELRTPLNAVLGFSGLIHERVAGPLTEKQADYVDEVVTSGQHLLALVDDVLHLSRIEEGTDDLQLRSFDLGAMVERSAALFHDEAARKGVRLHTAVPGGVVTIADERKVRQIVFNLVSNAVRLTPGAGKVSVSLTVAGDRVAISVTDTGPGIAPEDQDRIFEPFQQASSTPGQGGTGLGLAVARRFALLHGGSIGLQSEPGRGACFTVDLPLRAEPPSGTGVEVPTVPAADDTLERTVSDTISLLAAVCAALSCATTAAVALLAPPARSGPWGLALVACGLLVLVALVLRPRPGVRHGTAAGHLLVASTSIAVALLTAAAGSLGGYAANALALTSLTAAAAVPRRWVVAHLAAGSIALGVVMGVQPGWSTPVLRWEHIVVLAAALCVVAVPLVERLHDLLRAEAAARSSAVSSAAAIEAAMRHRSEFVATMSHELRTPLNAIIGFSEALRMEVFGPITPKQAEYLDDILVADQHLLALVNDVLDLAKLDAGLMPEPRHTVEVVHLADAVEVGLRELGLARLGVVELAEGLPPVVGDPAVVARILVELSAWVADRSAGPDAVRLTAQLDGEGVRVTASAATSQEVDVEEAFTELPPRPADQRRGTGLGMAWAERQVHRHGGGCEAGTAAGVVALSAWLPAAPTELVSTDEPGNRLLGGAPGVR